MEHAVQCGCRIGDCAPGHEPVRLSAVCHCPWASELPSGSKPPYSTVRHRYRLDNKAHEKKPMSACSVVPLPSSAREACTPSSLIVGGVLAY